MNTDIEDLLCEGLDRLTADARVPAGLAARAQRGHRQRQFTLRAATAAGTALAAGAVAVAAIGTAGGRLGTRQQAVAGPRYQTAAYVVRHIEHALSLASTKIMFVSAHDNPASFGGTAPVLESWTYGGMTKSRKDAPGVTTDALTIQSGSSTTQLFVNYTQKVWYRGSWQSAPPTYATNVCAGPADDEPGYSSPSWPQFVSSSLACGGFRIAAHARVDGQPAYEIVGTAKDVDAKYVPQIMWVSAKSYLPVKIVYPFGYDQVGWLSPTPVNLALLQLSVPPGFHRIKAPWPVK